MKFVDDEWLSRYPISDKFAHYFAEFSTYHILMFHKIEIGWTILACIIGGLLVEIVQGIWGHGFSRKDLEMDILGVECAYLTKIGGYYALAGWIIFALVYIIFEWLPKRR